MALNCFPRCCRKYKIRSFNSRGGALVLVWNFCIVTATVAIGTAAADYLPRILNRTFLHFPTFDYVLLFILVIVVSVIMPLFGWFADRYNNFSLFKVGSIGLFIVIVLNCSMMTYTSALGDSFVSYPVLFAVLIVISVLGVCCIIAIFTVLLQLGLDQLPFASSENIASFLNWSFFFLLAGGWCGRTISSLMKNCIVHEENWTVILLLVSVIFMSIVLCSHFLLSNKWLIKDTASAQSLKNIYHVLKFAATHKSPINRSALTYWEDDIPSRIDLAKQRYGGPYTTEEVEDVKTFFKLLLVFLPLIFTLSGLLTTGPGFSVNEYLISLNNSTCFGEMVYSVTYSRVWYTVIHVPIYEFIIYPLIRNRLPSMLKRIGISSFLVILFKITRVSWAVTKLYVDIESSNDLFIVVSQIVMSLIFQCIVTTVFEFICAQSPYSKRGILIGFTTAIVVNSIVVNQVIVLLSHNFLRDPVISVVQVSITFSFSLIGFVLYCIASYKYKMRVREDIDNPHVWAENAYTKYFDQHDAYIRRLRST